MRCAIPGETKKGGMLDVGFSNFPPTAPFAPLRMTHREQVLCLVLSRRYHHVSRTFLGRLELCISAKEHYHVI